MSVDVIRITQEPLALDRVLNLIGHHADGSAGDDSEAGAVVTFSGIVRGTEHGAAIAGLDYEHYVGMAEKEMTRLVSEARQRWPLRRIALVHAVGFVPTARTSVVVAVSAGHRAEAFEAARFLIDELKRSVPVWKQDAAGQSAQET